MNDLLKNLKGLITVMNKAKWGVLIILLIGFMSYQFKEPITAWMMPNTEMRPVEETINRDVMIYKVLSDMLKEFEGGRAYVYTYHNGQNYLSNDPVVNHKQRASMDYEVVAPGVKEIGLQMQNIPVSLFAKQTEMILAEKILGISKEDTQDLAAKSLMADIGSSHAAVLPYRDSDGKVIMIIGVDWIMQDEIFFPEERFRRYVKDIGDIFMRYSESARMWNLRENRTRGGSEQVIEAYVPHYIEDHTLNYHFYAGVKILPKNPF